MNQPIFLPELPVTKPLLTAEGSEIRHTSAKIEVADYSDLGRRFADDIEKNMISDFRREGDKMVHVSTFAEIDGVIYMTYYANISTGDEDPKFQRARLVFCPTENPDDKTYIDVQAAGDDFAGKHVDAVYDTILMRMDDDLLYILWTANLSGNYYRLYRTYRISTGELGDIGANRLKVGDNTVDFSFSGIRNVFAAAGVPVKTMYSDIGIMQKQSWREENGERWYYSGAYSGDLNFIIKSRDLVTWEYVAQPDFVNRSKWENAVYVLENKCYYFVRQYDDTGYGFLTRYDLETGEWDAPVQVADCQSRGDFLYYHGGLYLVHAPTDREHIGILKIGTENLADSRPVFRAKMHESCFYPFMNFGPGGVWFSYTSARKHIRLSKFDPDVYLK